MNSDLSFTIQVTSNNRYEVAIHLLKITIRIISSNDMVGIKSEREGVGKILQN